MKIGNDYSDISHFSNKNLFEFKKLKLDSWKNRQKKNDISIMEINKNNRNTFSRRKMVSLKELFFMKKKEIINSPI